MQPDAKQLKLSAKWLKMGILSLVDLIYSFDDGIDAYEYLATGRAQGKVIISLS
jgi:NADPH:quinone reductase-like Zn-dependent oxidoreductase